MNKQFTATSIIIGVLGLLMCLGGCYYLEKYKTKSLSTTLDDKSLKLHPIELFDFINMFAPDQDSLHNSILDWANQANNTDILWSNSGILMSDDGFYRHGQAIVNINNQTFNCLDVKYVPCKWDLVLSGSRCGYNSCLIQSVHHQSLNKMSLNELFMERQFKSFLIEQNDITSRYKFSIPGKKPFFLSISWSCGSAGCSLKIICDYE